MYSRQFKLIGRERTAKWEEHQCRHFEKYCKYQPHSAFLPLEPEILFLPAVLCVFQKQLQPLSFTALPFIQFTGVDRMEMWPLIKGGIKRDDNLNR